MDSQTMTAMPPAIRILPMSTVEFADCGVEEIQKNFFLNELPDREGGRFLHYKYGLKTPCGSVILFQYRNAIVASALFLDAERFGVPDKDGYEGTLNFDVKSIRVFDPVSSAAVCGIWQEFKRFSHVKQSLNPQSYSLFQQGLTNIRAPMT